MVGIDKKFQPLCIDAVTGITCQKVSQYHTQYQNKFHIVPFCDSACLFHLIFLSSSLFNGTACRKGIFALIDDHCFDLGSPF